MRQSQSTFYISQSAFVLALMLEPFFRITTFIVLLWMISIEMLRLQSTTEKVHHESFSKSANIVHIICDKWSNWCSPSKYASPFLDIILCHIQSKNIIQIQIIDTIFVKWRQCHLAINCYSDCLHPPWLKIEKTTNQNFHNNFPTNYTNDALSTVHHIEHSNISIFIECLLMSNSRRTRNDARKFWLNEINCKSTTIWQRFGNGSRRFWTFSV